jgi:hypothetical protein
MLPNSSGEKNTHLIEAQVSVYRNVRCHSQKIVTIKVECLSARYSFRDDYFDSVGLCVRYVMLCHSE